MTRIFTLAVCLPLLTIPVLAQDPGNGQRQYQERCSGCHGDDGSGGGHGPSIIALQRFRATTRQAIHDVILKGIAEAGMPAFPIPAQEADAIAGYVLTLRNPAGAGTTAGAPGDAAAGERYYTGQGKCASCHMIRGRGGVLGPDLTNIGHDRRPAQLEQALRDPGGEPPQAGRGGRGGAIAYHAVTVKLRDGRVIRGIAKNESGFDLEVLGADNQLYELQKSQVAEIVHDKSLMPKVEATPAEMRDLVAYLSRLTVGTDLKRTLPGAVLEGGVPFADVAHPKPGTWPTYDGNESGNRFSPLNQINTGNVQHVAPKWMFSLPGAQRGLEVTPVVVDGVMYVTAVNEAFALDARNGREIWHYSRPRSPAMVGDAAGGINRGVAVLADRVFMVTDNAHLLALNRLSGALLWDVEMADSRQNYGSTGAPLVVNDLVIAGISGGDEGVRGVLNAYKASTGELAWRFWTVPAPGEPGSETWSGNAWEHGCGSTWLTGTYDPETNMLYWPTGNPCPDYNGDVRKGDNLYTSSVVALDPGTGKMKWYFQFTPHDLHDWDATETPILVDAQFHGETRKLLLQGNRNGFFYVLDRLTGKFLLAQPLVKKITWASGIGADGRPVLLPGNEPTVEGQLVCPSVSGAANWASSAFDPGAGLFYLFVQEGCNVYTKSDQVWEAGKSYYAGGERRAPSDPAVKFMKAIDIQTGKVVWETPEVGGGILGSGLIATAGGLIFYGDGYGAFVAADSKTGKPLWHFNTGQGWRSGPMTYMLDGAQYIGIASGSTILAFGLQ